MKKIGNRSNDQSDFFRLFEESFCKNQLNSTHRISRTMKNGLILYSTFFSYYCKIRLLLV
jgi:hypothetical protein